MTAWSVSTASSRPTGSPALSMSEPWLAEAAGRRRQVERLGRRAELGVLRLAARELGEVDVQPRRSGRPAAPTSGATSRHTGGKSCESSAFSASISASERSEPLVPAARERIPLRLIFRLLGGFQVGVLLLDLVGLGLVPLLDGGGPAPEILVGDAQGLVPLALDLGGGAGVGLVGLPGHRRRGACGRRASDGARLSSALLRARSRFFSSSAISRSRFDSIQEGHRPARASDAASDCDSSGRSRPTCALAFLVEEDARADADPGRADDRSTGGDRHAAGGQPDGDEERPGQGRGRRGRTGPSGGTSAA